MHSVWPKTKELAEGSSPKDDDNGESSDDNDDDESHSVVSPPGYEAKSILHRRVAIANVVEEPFERRNKRMMITGNAGV
jgi:hypothetical protein